MGPSSRNPVSAETRFFENNRTSSGSMLPESADDPLEKPGFFRRWARNPVSRRQSDVFRKHAAKNNPARPRFARPPQTPRRTWPGGEMTDSYSRNLRGLQRKKPIEVQNAQLPTDSSQDQRSAGAGRTSWQGIDRRREL